MRLRVQTDSFTTLLLAALGLAPIGACGGAVATNAGGGGTRAPAVQAGEGARVRSSPGPVANLDRQRGHGR